MRCPKCDNEMEEANYDNVVVDRCSSCQGIWFDTGEAEELSRRWIAEFIDTGDAEIGMIHNEENTVACPRCGETMNRMVAMEAGALQFEQCDEHGKFFDAGEFTLWAEQQYL